MPKASLTRQQAKAISELAEATGGPIDIGYDYGSYLIVTGKNLGRTKVWMTGKVEDAP